MIINIYLTINIVSTYAHKHQKTTKISSRASTARNKAIIHEANTTEEIVSSGFDKNFK